MSQLPEIISISFKNIKFYRKLKEQENQLESLASNLSLSFELQMGYMGLIYEYSIIDAHKSIKRLEDNLSNQFFITWFEKLEENLNEQELMLFIVVADYLVEQKKSKFYQSTYLKRIFKEMQKNAEKYVVNPNGMFFTEPYRLSFRRQILDPMVAAKEIKINLSTGEII